MWIEKKLEDFELAPLAYESHCNLIWYHKNRHKDRKTLMNFEPYRWHKLPTQATTPWSSDLVGR